MTELLTSPTTSLTASHDEINIKSITKCRMETMYDVSCMFLKMTNSTVSKKNLDSCIITHRPGSEFLQTAVVPMWVVYQFLVSVVLLRILIVMLTITYNKILANLNTQWKYARQSMAIFIAIYRLVLISRVLRHIVVLVSHCGGKFGTKYRWCCIGSSKLFEIFCIDFVGVSGSHYILKLGQNELFLLTI